MSIYGELDTAEQCLQRLLEKLAEDWKSGTVRMRQGDIDRAKKYLKNINKNSREIKKILLNFQSVV